MMSKYADLKPMKHRVRVFETDCEVTSIQTAKTVCEASGGYNGKSFSAKAGSRQAAVAQWKNIAERSED
jgi:hypothetical protein